MRKMKKFLTLAMISTLMFSSMTVNAAEVSMTAKQNADYMMSMNKDGVPNWFNGAYYSDRYKDLQVAFDTNEKALYNHSFQYGFNEGRLVTPVLDVAKYREFYPDLNKAFGDNWKLYVRHYFEYGINEGRENFTDFDAKTYLSMYPDLQNAFGDDLGLATRHYIEYGISEGREYNWPEPEIVYNESDNDNKDDNSSDSGSSDSGSSDNSSSDSGSSNNGNTDENFTGDIRTDNDDGSYGIDTYVNGVLTSGKWYYPSGNLWSEITYYESGACASTVYRADGTKSRYGEWDDKLNQILSISYQEDGVTEDWRTECTYDASGNRTSDKTTGADGSISEITYENGVRTYQVGIHADGYRVESEYYEDGYTNKKSTAFNTDGTKYVVEYWETGRMKTYTEYDASDNITRQYLYDEDGNIISDIVYTEPPSDDATSGDENSAE